MAPARRRVQKKGRKREKIEGNARAERNLVTITKAVVARSIYCPRRDSSLFKYFSKALSEIFHFPPTPFPRRLG